MKSTPLEPVTPSGSTTYTSSENVAADRSAKAVSRFVSWYSGAKLAHTSIP